MHNLWVPTSSEIIFEDEWIIAINKPSGLPSQATLDRSRHHLVKAVELYLAKKKRPVYVGLHHRLDRETSGVIVLAISRAANKGLAQTFREHRAKKVYLAITARPESMPTPEFVVNNHLAKRQSPGRPAKMVAVNSGGDWAETNFFCLAQARAALLLRALPKTGRMHQIRVHATSVGAPLLGDRQYAPPPVARRARRLMLHAEELQIEHPVQKTPLKLLADWPEDFRQCLNQESLTIDARESLDVEEKRS